MALKYCATRCKQKKNRNISCYQTTNLLLVCKKGQKEGYSEFVTRSVGIIVTIKYLWNC